MQHNYLGASSDSVHTLAGASSWSSSLSIGQKVLTNGFHIGARRFIPEVAFDAFRLASSADGVPMGLTQDASLPAYCDRLAERGFKVVLFICGIGPMGGRQVGVLRLALSSGKPPLVAGAGMKVKRGS